MKQLIILLLTGLILSSCTIKNSKEQHNTSHNIPYSVRGLSCNQNICLLGANKGRIGEWDLKTDSIYWMQPDPNNDSSQFRSTAITNEGTFYAIPAGAPMQIWRKALGEKWQVIFSDSNSLAFVDGILAVENKVYGYGDPISDSLYFFSILNKEVKFLASPKMKVGEAGFAASNSGIQFAHEKIYIGTGGTQSRVLVFDISLEKWDIIPTNMRTGEGKGIFALDVEEDQLCLVGGSYQEAKLTDSTCQIFQLPSLVELESPNLPYCSDIEIQGKNNAIATGRNGVFEIQGSRKIQIDTIPYYAIEETNQFIVFAGNGKLKRLSK